MEVNEIIAELRRMQVKIGSLTCLSCDHCGVRGCAILREAADALERMNDFDQTQSRKMLVKLQHAQAELDEMKRSGWISVKDRLPEVGGYVVCIAKRNPFSRFMPMAARIEKNGWVNPITEQYISEATHWMPLPSAEELK